MGRLRRGTPNEARNNYIKSLPQRNESITDGLCRESSLREGRDAENGRTNSLGSRRRGIGQTLYT
jgi:hypothetical protein